MAVAVFVVRQLARLAAFGAVPDRADASLEMRMLRVRTRIEHRPADARAGRVIALERRVRLQYCPRAMQQLPLGRALPNRVDIEIAMMLGHKAQFIGVQPR